MVICGWAKDATGTFHLAGAPLREFYHCDNEDELAFPYVSFERKIVLIARVAHLHTNNLPALKAKAYICTLVLAWLQKEPRERRKICRGTLTFSTQNLWSPHQNSRCFGWFCFSLLQFKFISQAVLGPFPVWSYSLWVIFIVQIERRVSVIFHFEPKVGKHQES